MPAHPSKLKYMPTNPLTVGELLVKLLSLSEEHLALPLKMITRDQRRFTLAVSHANIPENSPPAVVEGYTVYGVSANLEFLS